MIKNPRMARIDLLHAFDSFKRFVFHVIHLVLILPSMNRDSISLGFAAIIFQLWAALSVFPNSGKDLFL